MLYNYYFCMCAERCHAAAAGDASTREGRAEYERSLLALTMHVAEIAPVDTQEQRVTNLLQSTLCGACLGVCHSSPAAFCPANDPCMSPV